MGLVDICQNLIPRSREGHFNINLTLGNIIMFVWVLFFVITDAAPYQKLTNQTFRRLGAKGSYLPL